jgi:hypothetical protein
VGFPDDEHEADDERPLRRRSAGAAAMGRAMMGLGEIIEGKPPREVYEHVVEADESGDPPNPADLVIELD